jgi:hypothetical protein
MAETAARTGDIGQWVPQLEELLRMNQSYPVCKMSHMPLGWRAEEEMIQRVRERERERETERHRKRNLQVDRVIDTEYLN